MKNSVYQSTIRRHGVEETEATLLSVQAKFEIIQLLRKGAKQCDIVADRVFTAVVFLFVFVFVCSLFLRLFLKRVKIIG